MPLKDALAYLRDDGKIEVVTDVGKIGEMRRLTRLVAHFPYYAIKVGVYTKEEFDIKVRPFAEQRKRDAEHYLKILDMLKEK